MITRRIDLYEYFNVTRPDGATGYLDVYTHPIDEDFSKNKIRPAMLIIPGGGYAYVSPREKEPIVMKYLAEGFNCYALTYSVLDVAKYPIPVIEAVMAMLYVKETAEELHTSVEKVCSVGFSAGGQLNGMLITAFGNKEIVEVLGERAKDACPNATIFSYAVIRMEGLTHNHTISKITGDDKALYPICDVASNVKETTPPAFIWATVEDSGVPVESSLDLALAYKKVQVPFELHLYEKGSHGLSTATEEVNTPNAPVSTWIDLSVTWLKQRGFVPYNKEVK